MFVSLGAPAGFYNKVLGKSLVRCVIMFDPALSPAVSYLASLPKDSEELLSNYTSSSYHDRSSSSTQAFSNPQTPPLSIVLYVLCNNLQLLTSPAPTSSPPLNPSEPASSSSSSNSAGQEERMECLRLMKVLSELLSSDGIPTFIRERLVVQVGSIWGMVPFNVLYCMSFDPSQLLDPKELLGPSSGCSGQLRSLAFSVYTRCRPQAEISIEGARSLTTFGPIADRLNHSQVGGAGTLTVWVGGQALPTVWVGGAGTSDSVGGECACRAGDAVSMTVHFCLCYRCIPIDRSTLPLTSCPQSPP